MQLPQELIAALTLLIGGLITTLVVDGFKALSEVLKFDLSKLGTVIAAAASAFVVAVVIGAVNFGLSFVPPEWFPLVQGLFVVLLTLLGGMGLHRRAKMARPQ